MKKNLIALMAAAGAALMAFSSRAVAYVRPASSPVTPPVERRNPLDSYKLPGEVIPYPNPTGGIWDTYGKDNGQPVSVNDPLPINGGGGLIGRSGYDGAMPRLGVRGWVPPEAARPYIGAIFEAEQVNNIPRGLLVRQLAQESGFNPRAVNTRSGAQGIAQLMPRWHPDNRWWSGSVDAFEPFQAIRYAGRMMRFMRNLKGDWTMALASYNWGEKYVSEWVAGQRTMPQETRDYIDIIAGDILGASYAKVAQGVRYT